jgi:hypothetical protein
MPSPRFAPADSVVFLAAARARDASRRSMVSDAA